MNTQDIATAPYSPSVEAERHYEARHQHAKAVESAKLKLSAELADAITKNPAEGVCTPAWRFPVTRAYEVLYGALEPYALPLALLLRDALAGKDVCHQAQWLVQAACVEHGSTHCDAEAE